MKDGKKETIGKLTLAMAWTNAAAAAGMIGGLALLLLASLNCSQLMEPDGPPLDRRDSLAMVAILRVNPRANQTFNYSVSRNAEGRINHLYLSSGNLDTLPDELGELTELQTLDLSYNNLGSLPKAVERLVNLTSLNVRNNRITAFPDGLRSVHLRILDASSNLIEHLPVNVEVTALETLILSGNQIRSLPPDFKYLTRLRSLELRNNRLESLDVDFGGLALLRFMDFSGNRITGIPASLLELGPDSLDMGLNRLCFYREAEPDSASRASLLWLDQYDRDWRTSQSCP